MEYLTAVEFSKKWCISSRMIAYYCESGRINGAVKKGKAWLIPIDAEKPADKRFSKNKIVIQDNDELQGDLQKINKLDTESISTVYRSNDLYQNLGLTRETLRYYEEIGLIAPQRNKASQYREFTFADVSRLMSIDFYKKRGFTPLEIRKLMQSEQSLDEKMLNQKISEMENIIKLQQLVLSRLAEAKAFYEYAARSEREFTVKELPSYLVLETFDAVSSLKEYQNSVLTSLNMQEEDILSSLVRAVTFDSSGYKGTQMCMVKPAEKVEQLSEKVYLESGRCLHTVMSADSHDDSLMENMFYSCYEWAAQNHEAFQGVVYIFIRFVSLSEQTERNFYEVWIPLK